jgi:hypothetical protein
LHLLYYSIIAAGLTCGCSQTGAVGAESASRDTGQRVPVDSIVLERSLTMPGDPGTGYRLRLDGEGGVHIRMYKGPRLFESRATPAVVESVDSVARDVVSALAAEAARIGFYGLPEKLRGVERWCPIEVTDARFFTTTIYRAGAVHRVQLYTGCYRDEMSYGAPLEDRVVFQLRPLVRFNTAIEMAADISRWIKWAEPQLAR